MSCTIPNRIQSPSETYEQSTICTSIGFLDLCALTKPIKVHLQRGGASLGLALHKWVPKVHEPPSQAYHRLITEPTPLHWYQVLVRLLCIIVT